MRFKPKRGLAVLPVATGTIVALGASLLVAGLVGGVLVATDVLEGENEVAELGTLGGLGLTVALFVAYLWGGYTAGRMARSTGVRIGLLVAATSLTVSAAAAVGASAADLDSNLTVPFMADRLPIEAEVDVDWSAGFGVLALIAIFAGAAAGGARGVAWHSRVSEEPKREPEPPPTHAPDPRPTGGLTLGTTPPEGHETDEQDTSLPRYR